MLNTILFLTGEVKVIKFFKIFTIILTFFGLTLSSVYAEPKKHNLIKKELKKIGVLHVDFKFEKSGADVFDVNNL